MLAASYEAYRIYNRIIYQDVFNIRYKQMRKEQTDMENKNKKFKNIFLKLINLPIVSLNEHFSCHIWRKTKFFFP